MVALGSYRAPTISAEALDEPLAAFPLWFLRITCDRCGKDRIVNEAHETKRLRNMAIGAILDRVHPAGCCGRAEWAGATH